MSRAPPQPEEVRVEIEQLYGHVINEDYETCEPVVDRHAFVDRQVRKQHPFLDRKISGTYKTKDK